jgi:hypothetical protein
MKLEVRELVARLHAKLLEPEECLCLMDMAAGMQYSLALESHTVDRGMELKYQMLCKPSAYKLLRN